MPDLKLTALPRAETGKNVNRRLRAKGMIPAVAYGAGKDPQSLAVSVREIERVLHKDGAHAIVDLEIQGAAEGKDMAMLGQIQRDPIDYSFIHADLIRVRLDKAIHTTIEVVPLGAAPGVREGGILERPSREVEISALPLDLPKSIEVDISQLGINGVVRASDLQLGDKIHLLSDPEAVLFHVVIPRAAVEAAPVAAEGEAGAEAKAEEGKEAEKK